jgi:hypothetical protein
MISQKFYVIDIRTKLQISQIQLLAMYVGVKPNYCKLSDLCFFSLVIRNLSLLQKSSYKTEYLNGTDLLIDSSYRPPAPEAIISLHLDSFWLSSSQENIAQILT